MDFWETVKRDIQKSLRDGIIKVREGVTVVKAKAEELTEEGRRRIRILDLKTKVQREISELGGRVYTISQKSKSQLSDKKVQTIITRIKKLEEKIVKLEGKHIKKPKGKSAGRRMKM